MKFNELAARILIGALLAVAVGTPVWLWSRTPLIHARLAENGGWAPNVLQATAGLPLHLRLTSDDVMHGFAVGQTDMQSADIEPGKVTDVTLTFRKPGIYTFYCTRWCGINHWRMRGTIEVNGGEPAPSNEGAPLYVSLGLDLDAPHNSPVVPGSQPSALSGQQNTGQFSMPEFTSVEFYRSHSPYATWKELRAQASLAKLDDQQVWDMVAFIWQSNTTPDGIAEGQRLFAQNCAACHGESGASNGVFADQLAQAGAAGGPDMTVQRPADFTDPQRMLGASPALLEGKILRGGMGTGMPSWGPIFNEAQIQAIVSYLYTFQFKENAK